MPGDRSWDYGPTTNPSAPAPKPTQNPHDVWGLGTYYNRPVFVGVDYSTQVTANEGQDLVAGKYATTSATDAYAKTQKLLNDVAKMWTQDPAGYEALQQQLQLAGYLPDNYIPGAFDGKTQAAFKSVIEDYLHTTQSSAQPMTLSEFVSTNAAAGQAAAAKAAAAKATATPTFSVTDPSSIRAAAQAAFQAADGRGATEAELNRFIGKFQAEQMKFEGQTGGGTVVTPSLTDEAMQFAQSSNPAEYKQHQVQAYTNTLLNMFLPGESQRANTQPVPSA